MPIISIYTVCGLLTIQLVLCLQTVDCQTGTDARNLRKQLFETNGYDKKVRPRLDQTDVIEVNISFSLLSINELSEVTETLRTTGFLTVSWYDDYLTWNETEYGGLYYYQWPQDDIWKPDVALRNSFLDYKELGVATLNVEIYSDGSINWYPFQVFQSTCSVDISYFPFDIQTCQLIFVAWSYTPFEVIMQSGENGISMDAFETNSEWDIIDTDWVAENKHGADEIAFTLKLKRKPLYVLLAIIMPIVMLAVLNIFVFILPCESGERASYSVTVFLAFAVFLTIVSSTLPENSESVAMFSIFLIIQMVQSTMITLLALVMIRCHSFDETVPVPWTLQFVLRVTTCMPFRENRQRRENSGRIQTREASLSDQVSVPQGDKRGVRAHSVEVAIVDSCDWSCRENRKVGTNTDNVRDMNISTVEEFDNTVNTKNSETKAECKSTQIPNFTWRQVVNRLDIIFFVFFIVVFVVSVVVCATIGANHTG